MVKRKSEEEQAGMLLHCGKAVLWGCGTAFLMGIALLLLAALGVSRGLVDSGLRYQLTVVSCVLGSFAGGLLAVRNAPATVHGLFMGVAVGGALFLIQLSLGLLLYEELTMGSGGMGLLFGDLCGGAAAGILGRGGKRRKTGRNKKRRSR